MSKHAPGPWSKNKFGEVVSANGELVRIEGVALSGLSTPETRANRDLFFASPVLLEACEEFRNVLRSKIRDGKYREEYAEAFYQAELKMERAIARAKGESQ